MPEELDRQCPQCAATVPAQALSCLHCGAALPLLQVFREIQQDFQVMQVQATTLSEQLHHLQEKFDALATRLDPTAASPGPLAEPPEATPVPVVPAPSATASDVADAVYAPEPLAISPRDAEVRFGQKWLLIVGVSLTVLGIGFFLKYAFDQNWVGPAGRIALAYLAAGGFLGGGEWFRRREAPTFGLSLLGGGVATLYLSTFAAFQLYGLLSQPVAFAFMALVTALAGVFALLYDEKWLAVLGLIGGFLTPVILSTGQDKQLVFMSYLVLLNLGILGIAARKQWRLLNALGCFLTWVLFTGWYVDHYSATRFWPTMIFLNIFFLTYALAPFVYYLVRERHEPITGVGLTVPNTFVAFGFAFTMIERHTSLPAVSLVTLAYAGFFLWLARFLYQRQPEHLEPFVLLLAKGLLFLIITIPLLLSAQWITVFWTAQAVGLLWAALRVRNRWLVRGAVLLLLLAVGKFVLYDAPEHFALEYRGLWFWQLAYAQGFTALWLARWITALVVCGGLWQMTQMLARAEPSVQPWPGQVAGLLGGLWIVVVFVVLNAEVSTFFYDYAPQAHFAAISVLWALLSILLMGVGFLRNQALLRKGALGLFAATLLKVFLADMADVSTPFRIISFVVLGLMLIGASYLYYRYREHILPAALGENRP